MENPKENKTNKIDPFDITLLDVISIFLVNFIMCMPLCALIAWAMGNVFLSLLFAGAIAAFGTGTYFDDGVDAFYENRKNKT